MVGRRDASASYQRCVLSASTCLKKMPETKIQCANVLCDGCLATNRNQQEPTGTNRKRRHSAAEPPTRLKHGQTTFLDDSSHACAFSAHACPALPRADLCRARTWRGLSRVTCHAATGSYRHRSGLAHPLSALRPLAPKHRTQAPSGGAAVGGRSTSRASSMVSARRRRGHALFL